MILGRGGVGVRRPQRPAPRAPARRPPSLGRGRGRRREICRKVKAFQPDQCGLTSLLVRANVIPSAG